MDAKNWGSQQDSDRPSGKGTINGEQVPPPSPSQDFPEGGQAKGMAKGICTASCADATPGLAFPWPGLPLAWPPQSRGQAAFSSMAQLSQPDPNLLHCIVSLPTPRVILESIRKFPDTLNLV